MGRGRFVVPLVVVLMPICRLQEEEAREEARAELANRRAEAKREAREGRREEREAAAAAAAAQHAAANQQQMVKSPSEYSMRSLDASQNPGFDEQTSLKSVDGADLRTTAPYSQSRNNGKVQRKVSSTDLLVYVS